MFIVFINLNENNNSAKGAQYHTEMINTAHMMRLSIFEI